MIQKAVSNFSVQIVISTFSFPEHTRLHISLTFPGPEKHIPPSSAGNHPSGNIMMFMFIPVRFQLRPVFIPFKMSTHLITDIFQIRVISQLISSVITNRPDSFGLCPNRIHDTHGVNDPYKRRLPVNALQDSLQRLIGGNMVRTFFSSHPGDRIRKQRIIPAHLKLNRIPILQIDSPPRILHT